jgi:PAS domain S-box-containing protein
MEHRDLPTGLRSQLLARYIAAAALVAVAFFLTVLLKSHFGQIPNSLFFCAVILAAWYGGMGPGLLASVLSVATIEYFLRPSGTVFETGAGELSRSIVFFFASFLISWICSKQKLGAELLRRARDELEAKVLERTQDLQRVNEELRRSEMYLAEGQRLSHTGSWAWNFPARDRVYWSKEEFRIYGFDPGMEVAPYREVLLRIHPEDRTKYESSIETAIREKKDFELELRIVLPDKSMKHLYIIGHPVIDASGDVVQFIGTTMDVTERKEAEEKLRESETYLAEAQRLSHTGSWAWCPDTGGLRYWSEECFRLLGFEPGGGVPPRDQFIQRIHPDDRVRFVERLERAKREKTSYDVEYRYILPSGEIRDIHTVGHPVLSPSGDLREFVGTVIDDTQRKRAEATLRKTEADLARVARATTLGELTASIAHEVNQPIAAVVTNANACLRWLKGETPNLDRAREAAERIIRDGNRASDVIIRIRTLLKGGESDHKQVEINDVIREVAALAQGAITLHRASLEIALAEELPPIWGDRVQLQQVLLNLVANALDAMETISDRPRIVRICSEREQAETIRVTVKDSGVGLNPQQMENLFNAFHTTKREGMGMGLTISRSIVERHGGRLWAEANQGEPGALFQFTLPVMEGDES